MGDHATAKLNKHAHFGTDIMDFNGFRRFESKSIEIRNIGTEVSVFIYPADLLNKIYYTLVTHISI